MTGLVEAPSHDHGQISRRHGVVDMPAPEPPSTATGIAAAGPSAVWLLWDCAELVAVYDTERGARIAQADALFQILCTVGRDMDRLGAITVTPAVVHSTDTDPAWVTP